MPYQYVDCEVTKIIQETADVRRFIIRYPDPVQLTFKPGQFIMLDLPIDSKYTNRSYSIASPPNNENTLELVIVINPAGLGTPYLFQEIKIGSLIRCTLPLGKFRLIDPLDREVCFICTGTGIAPFRSMLLDTLNHSVPSHKMILIMGARTQQDLLYRTELEELSEQFPVFQLHIALSRDTSPDWKGYKGYVHQVYLERYKEPSDTIFYLCGWAAMLKEARENLQNLVFDKKQIRFESYD